MKLFAFGLLGWLTLAFSGLGAAPADSPFTLAIVPTRTYDQIGMRSMWMDRPFYVVLTNVSDKPQRIFEDWSSWGNFLLSFQFVSADGKVIAVEKVGPLHYTRNWPAQFEIPAGSHYVWRIDWKDKNWPNLRTLLDKWPESMVVKAVFEEPANNLFGKAPFPDNKATDVWKGQAVSKPETFKIVWD